MLERVYKNRFVKDLEKAKKRGLDLQKLHEILDALEKEKTLTSKNKNHKLKGNYEDHWECHVGPNWLLIYYKTKTELVLVRTGSHSDLF